MSTTSSRDKTKKIIINVRKNQSGHTSLFFNNTSVVDGQQHYVSGGDEFTWSMNSPCLGKKAQQRLHVLLDQKSLLAPIHPHHILKKHHREHLDQLHLCVVWSLQSFWLEGCEESGEDSRERAPPPRETPPPSTQDITPRRCLSRARIIISDPSQPHHALFSLLASRKRFCSIRCRTTRLCNRFFPHIIRLLTTNSTLPLMLITLYAGLHVLHTIFHCLWPVYYLPRMYISG